MMYDNHEKEYKRFAETEEEANRRYEIYKSSDPFPSIPPALLNSADISDYVSAAGMICPFEDSKERLKSASYLVRMLGECVYWDDSGEKKTLDLKEGAEFKLLPNSIAFVTLEPTFRLPDYIAIRFNLQISHVYKGLLLGTGPLVDPGFAGVLSIPLHNLTSNEYTLRGGDPIIWMEFTKLSPHNTWQQFTFTRIQQGKFREFPARKLQRKSISDYLERAVGREGTVRSSIPVAFEHANASAKVAADSAKEAASSARDAAEKVENVRQRVTVGAVVSAILLILSLLALIVPILSLVQDAYQYTKSAAGDVDKLERKVDELEKKVNELQQRQERSAQLPAEPNQAVQESNTPASRAK